MRTSGVCRAFGKRLNNLTMKYDDGLHMYYINAEVNDCSSIAKLMQYFKTAEADDLSQGKLSKVYEGGESRHV